MQFVFHSRGDFSRPRLCLLNTPSKSIVTMRKTSLVPRSLPAFQCCMPKSFLHAKSWELPENEASSRPLFFLCSGMVRDRRRFAVAAVTLSCLGFATLFLNFAIASLSSLTSKDKTDVQSWLFYVFVGHAQYYFAHVHGLLIGNRLRNGTVRFY